MTKIVYNIGVNRFMKTTKIVYNNCFGGASLSDKAIERYAEIKGITLFKSDEKSWLSGTSNYYRCTEDVYNTLSDLEKDNFHFSGYTILGNRTDPVLVQVIEELGDESNGDCAGLQITELPAGTQYHIHEYDGSETVMTPDDYEWKIA